MLPSSAAMTVSWITRLPALIRAHIGSRLIRITGLPGCSPTRRTCPRIVPRPPVCAAAPATPPRLVARTALPTTASLPSFINILLKSIHIAGWIQADTERPQFSAAGTQLPAAMEPISRHLVATSCRPSYRPTRTTPPGRGTTFPIRKRDTETGRGQRTIFRGKPGNNHLAANSKIGFLQAALLHAKRRACFDLPRLHQPLRVGRVHVNPSVGVDPLHPRAGFPSP